MDKPLVGAGLVIVLGIFVILMRPDPVPPRAPAPVSIAPPQRVAPVVQSFAARFVDDLPQVLRVRTIPITKTEHGVERLTPQDPQTGEEPVATRLDETTSGELAGRTVSRPRVAPPRSPADPPPIPEPRQKIRQVRLVADVCARHRMAKQYYMRGSYRYWRCRRP